MTMFRELYALASAVTLTMIVSADEKTGKLTVSVLPKPKKDVGEPGLTKNLTLTATPEEFDAEFIDALRGYRERRESLAEQAEATNKVLEAAKTLSAKKASEATSRAVKAAQAAKASSPAATQATSDERVGTDSDDRAESNWQRGGAPGATPQLFG
jgi:PRTRC genetic system protein E